MVEKTINTNDGEVREKMDFRQLIFLELWKAANENQDDYVFERNLDVIEATIAPYIDSEYLTNMKDPTQRLNDLKRLNGDKVTSRDYCRTKLMNLMCLARRKGLLPEEGSEYKFTED